MSNNEDLETLEKGVGVYHGSPRRVAIVGAGMAGLVSAWLLMRAGLNVHVYEASPRVGGRVKTLREGFSSDLYAEAGAMRVPYSHRLTHFLCTEVFGLRLVEFPEREANTWIYVNGRHVLSSAYQRPDQFGHPYRTALKSADLLDRVLHDLHEDVDLSALLYDGKPSEGVAALRSRLDAISLGDYLRGFTSPEPRNIAHPQRKTDVRLDPYDIDLISFDLSAFELRASLLEALRHHDVRSHAGPKFQILGGMDLLPRSFLQTRPGATVEPMADRIRFSARVTEIVRTSTGLGVCYEQSVNRSWARDEVDFLVLAAPFSALAHVRFRHEADQRPAISGAKLHAIRSLHYENATKIVLEFTDRFWDNGIERINGGRSFTDLPIRWILYPSREQHPPGSRRGVLLASYTLGEDSFRWTSLTPENRIRFALRNVAEVHLGAQPHKRYDDLVEEYERLLVGGMSHSWVQDEYSFGAFAVFEPYQETDLYRTIVEPEQSVYFAGEHASLKHGWIEGAVESGIRVAREVFADAMKEAPR